MVVHFTGRITDMSVNINLNKIKRRCFLFFCIFFFGIFSWGFYWASVPDITDIIESRSIIYFFLGFFYYVVCFPGCLLFRFGYCLYDFYEKHGATQLLRQRHYRRFSRYRCRICYWQHSLVYRHILSPGNQLCLM